MIVDTVYSRVCSLYTEAQDALQNINTLEDLHDFEQNHLSKKKGLLFCLKEIKNLSPEDKKTFGPKIHGMVSDIQASYQEKRNKIQQSILTQQLESDWIDVTKKTPSLAKGNIHPLAQTQRTIEQLFQSLGFEIADGPEIETEWYNFDALDIPDTHPARDMQDTFWVSSNANIENLVLRTQTSNVQIRTMEKGAPVRIIAPGRVYRNEETDTTHDSIFYQVEGLIIDKNISLAHLKGVIENMLEGIFQKQMKVRFRPGYFPFVEPGLEVDIWFEYTDKDGNQKSQWLEFMGAGMVHPQVLKNCNIDPTQYTGFAFGFGLTRLVMIQHAIEDIRLLFSQKKSFLSQF